jgi:hypothetical protein
VVVCVGSFVKVLFYFIIYSIDMLRAIDAPLLPFIHCSSCLQPLFIDFLLSPRILVVLGSLWQEAKSQVRTPKNDKTTSASRQRTSREMCNV